MRYLLPIALLHIFHALSAFNSSDTSQIKIQYEKAFALNQQKDFKNAAGIARTALQALRSLPERPLALEVGLIHILGDCALDRGDFSEALIFYEQANGLLEGRKQPEHPLLLDHINKMGNYYLTIKDFETALSTFDRALNLGRDLLGPKDLKIADIFNNIGTCYRNIGDPEKALDYQQQALALRSDQLPEPHPLVAQSYNNIGLCYLDKGDYQGARQAFLEAVGIYSAYYGQDHQDLADVYLNSGNVYYELRHPDLFSNYYRPLEFYSNTFDSLHPAIALCYNNLANAYSREENFERAAELYRKALEIRLRKYGNVHPDVAMSYFNIGVSNYSAGAVQPAAAAFEACFKSLHYRPRGDGALEEVNDPHTLLKLLEFKVGMEIEAFKESGNSVHLSNCHDYYQQIDRLLDFLRGRYEAEGSKLRLADAAHDIYDSAIGLALILYQLSREEDYLHEAFRFSEKSKGILLLEALNKTDAETFAGVPSELIAEIGDLESAISTLEKKRFLIWQHSGSQDQALIDSLNERIFERKYLLTERIRMVEKEFPQYYRLRYETATIPVGKIQRELLAPGQCIIEYFLGTSQLYIFVVRKSDFEVKSVDVDQHFFQALYDFNQSIRDFPTVAADGLVQNLSTYGKAAYDLFQYLIKPVEDLIEEQLIIIPDGELGYLSFGALLTEFPEAVDVLKAYPYLVRDYSVNFNYSVTLWKEMLEHKGKKRLQPYLGLAPEFKEGNVKGLPELKYNVEEVEHMGEMIGGRVLFNQEASKANFLALQSGFRIIHLATHGKANSTAGDYSFLAFSETPGAEGDDALLFVKEIYSISTNAEMVVLSACETGFGELQKGEGIASIARSFSYAGAQSLVATQWNVDDKATHDLVRLFFGHINDGMPKDRALQAAMLAFIRNGGQRHAHPYYWASFIPIGNMEGLSLGRSFPSFAWGLPVLFLLLGMVYLFGKKRLAMKNRG